MALEAVIDDLAPKTNTMTDIPNEDGNGPYGDGHYCTHHPDDPAHGPKCYVAPKNKTNES